MLDATGMSVSLREALAEKLMAFPRRLASHLSKSPAAERLDNDSGWDKALVRHLFDVHKIVKAHPQNGAGFGRTLTGRHDGD